MNDSVRMSEFECPRDRQDEANHLSGGASPKAREVSARQVLHRNPGVLVGAKQPVDRQNVGMLQCLDAIELALQSSDRFGVLRQRVGKDFHRDPLAALLILRQPNGTASAHPEGADQDEPCRKSLPALHHGLIF